MSIAITKNHKMFYYVDEIPKGYKKIENAATAPRGFTWYWNRKSIFSKEYHAVLVKDK